MQQSAGNLKNAPRQNAQSLPNAKQKQDQQAVIEAQQRAKAQAELVQLVEQEIDAMLRLRQEILLGQEKEKNFLVRFSMQDGFSETPLSTDELYAIEQELAQPKLVEVAGRKKRINPSIAFYRDQKRYYLSIRAPELDLEAMTDDDLSDALWDIAMLEIDDEPLATAQEDWVLAKQKETEENWRAELAREVKGLDDQAARNFELAKVNQWRLGNVSLFKKAGRFDGLVHKLPPAVQTVIQAHRKETDKFVRQRKAELEKKKLEEQEKHGLITVENEDQTQRPHRERLRNRPSRARLQEEAERFKREQAENAETKIVEAKPTRRDAYAQRLRRGRGRPQPTKIEGKSVKQVTKQLLERKPTQVKSAPQATTAESPRIEPAPTSDAAATAPSSQSYREKLRRPSRRRTQSRLELESPPESLIFRQTPRQTTPDTQSSIGEEYAVALANQFAQDAQIALQNGAMPEDSVQLATSRPQSGLITQGESVQHSEAESLEYTETSADSRGELDRRMHESIEGDEPEPSTLADSGLMQAPRTKAPTDDPSRQVPPPLVIDSQASARPEDYVDTPRPSAQTLQVPGEERVRESVASDGVTYFDGATQISENTLQTYDSARRSQSGRTPADLLGKTNRSLFKALFPPETRDSPPQSSAAVNPTTVTLPQETKAASVVSGLPPRHTAPSGRHQPPATDTRKPGKPVLPPKAPPLTVTVKDSGRDSVTTTGGLMFEEATQLSENTFQTERLRDKALVPTAIVEQAAASLLAGAPATSVASSHRRFDEATQLSAHTLAPNRKRRDAAAKLPTDPKALVLLQQSLAAQQKAVAAKLGALKRRQNLAKAPVLKPGG